MRKGDGGRIFQIYHIVGTCSRLNGPHHLKHQFIAGNGAHDNVHVNTGLAGEVEFFQHALVGVRGEAAHRQGDCVVPIPARVAARNE